MDRQGWRGHHGQNQCRGHAPDHYLPYSLQPILCFWSLNTSRIIYVFEESGEVERFGYGTLPGHGERDEERFLVERFLVERDREDGSVYYDVFAFSRPNHPLAWFGYLFARALQRRFARGSKKAMIRAVARSTWCCR